MKIIFICTGDSFRKYPFKFSRGIKRKNPKLKNLGLQDGALAEPELACIILILNVYFLMVKILLLSLLLKIKFTRNL